MSSMTLREITVFPVKSARGVSVERADVRERGFEGDRRWMFVDEDGGFVSQRECRALARLDASWSSGSLTLAHEGDSIQVEAGDERRQVEVWGDRVNARMATGEVATWLERCLGSRLNMAFMDDHSTRRIGDREAQVSFADGYPYLLTTEASLRELEHESGLHLEMARFRPNLVVDGDAPFDEHGWSSVRIAGVEFEVVSPCSRCVVTTLDPLTGEAQVDNEPMRTLARINRIDSKACFGVNLIARASGTLSVGDRVTVECLIRK